MNQVMKRVSYLSAVDQLCKLGFKSYFLPKSLQPMQHGLWFLFRLFSIMRYILYQLIYCVHLSFKLILIQV